MQQANASRIQSYEKHIKSSAGDISLISLSRCEAFIHLAAPQPKKAKLSNPLLKRPKLRTSGLLSHSKIMGIKAP